MTPEQYTRLAGRIVDLDDEAKHANPGEMLRIKAERDRLWAVLRPYAAGEVDLEGRRVR